MKKYLFTSLLTIFVIGVIALGLRTAKANPSSIIEAKTASATTTISYLTAGTGTTTVSLDTQNDGGAPADKAALMIQFTASSTSSVLNINLEYSQDNINWFQDGILTQTATTTSPVLISSADRYTWTYASSTPGGAITSATNNTDYRIVNVQTPARYVRAVFTNTGTSAGVWADLLVKRENR